MNANNKKIVKFNGGLGNQMFQYAFALSVADKFKTNFALDFSWFEAVKKHELVVPRVFGLNVFNLECPAATNEDLSEVKYPNFDSKFKRSLAKMFPKFFNVNYVSEKHTFCFDNHLFNYPHYFYYEGYFQNEKYFKHLRAALLKSFSLKAPLSQFDQKTQSVLDEIIKTNSVSIHIRRGDYVSLDHVSKTHGTCSLEYYKRAIEYIAEKVEKPHFFLFSDDIDWVVGNLELKYPYTVVDFNQDKPYLDLELMKNCKHNITANSSFSWWGAWLNENPQKIVISPKRWILQKKKCDIAPKEWVKL